LAQLNGYFVTGTDTNVGKTEIACALAYNFSKTSLVSVRKPVESGCKLNNGVLITHDSAQLQLAAGCIEDIDTICLYKFEPSISAESAALEAGVDILLNDLVVACQSDNMVIVEGAGGWLSPIGKDITNADLAEKLNLPIVLVVADKLGCVNHTLLTLNSIHNKNLFVEKIFLMQTDIEQKTSYIKDLTRWVDLPIIRCGFVNKQKPWKSLIIS